jgi:branched-chain amino acid transport system ATP-binding protein
MLTVKGLHVRYGFILAVKDVSFTLKPGECLGLIGANGAGKSSILKTLAGLLPASGGQIVLDGLDITLLDARKRVEQGIILVPEGRHVFSQLSVRENLLLGAHLRKDKDINSDVQAMAARFPALGERMPVKAGSLSGGQQQMLAIARAMMARPKLLLLDEPTMGLSPKMANEVFAYIRELKETGMPMILSGQEVGKVLRACDNAMVLETGRIADYGSAQALSQSDKVKKAYLGI